MIVVEIILIVGYLGSRVEGSGFSIEGYAGLRF